MPNNRAVPSKAIKTIFFDRDGVINDVVIRGTVIASPRSVDELKLREDFVSFYQSLASAALNFFIVSNQPDVARRLMSPEDLNSITQNITAQANFREVRYCTHDDRDNCHCRKPKPGMITELLEKYNLSPDEAIIVGDSYKDILAGNAAGIGTVYLLGSYNASVKCEPNFTVRSLHDITQHYTFARV
jgi:D-glycero-D-manno-heptose 1,7-bisphosphate phosphatase